MRIIVFSDTHGKASSLFDVVEKHKKTTDIFIHLGDGECEADMVKMAYPEIDLRYVRGNCDVRSGAPMSLLIEADHGRKIYATHGHMMSVKYGIGTILKEAKAQGASIVLFGHTHERFSYYDSDSETYVLNPGSLSQPRDEKLPSYAVIDIVKSGVVMNITDFLN